MKPTTIIKFLFALAFTFAAGNSFAQQQWGPEWGENEDQEGRTKNVLMFNYYKDAYDNKNYDDAMNYFNELVVKAPRSRNTLYVYAINIYKTKIQRERDPRQKGVLVDSLMTLYDLRMQYFGDDAKYGTPYILKQKARDYLVFKGTDIDGISKVFNEAIDANMADPDLDFINIYFKKLTDEYTAMEIETDFYLAEYEKLNAIIEGVTDPSAAEAKTTFNALVISSKALDCDGIEKIYKDKIAADPNNEDNYAKAFTLLSNQDCNSAFFFEIGDRYFQMEPTFASARVMAKAYEKQGNLRKALEYLRAAVEAETDPVVKATTCVEISGMEYTAGNYQSAANFARQAMQYNPENGFAYMFLAQAYVSAGACEDTFDRQTVYWLAYDLAQRARNIFSGSPEDQARATELMTQYRTIFPSKEEIFFRGLSEGARYDVKCGWVTGSTTVREGSK